jgi:hypothetical protein
MFQVEWLTEKMRAANFTVASMVSNYDVLPLMQLTACI